MVEERKSVHYTYTHCTRGWIPQGSDWSMKNASHFWVLIFAEYFWNTQYCTNYEKPEIKEHKRFFFLCEETIFLKIKYWKHNNEQLLYWNKKNIK